MITLHDNGGGHRAKGSEGPKGKKQKRIHELPQWKNWGYLELVVGVRS